MSFTKKPHNFEKELQALCAEDEEVTDKRPPVEIKRGKVKFLKTLAKGAFSQRCSCLLKENGEFVARVGHRGCRWLSLLLRTCGYVRKASGLWCPADALSRMRIIWGRYFGDSDQVHQKEDDG